MRTVTTQSVQSRTGALSFIHDALPGRILFGAGQVNALREEVERLGADRVLVISDNAVGASVAEAISTITVATIDEVRVHVPTEDVEAAERLVAQHDPALTVCIGGGSTIGLAKALAFRKDLPLLAVPTTYSGSEMTPIYGVTSGEEKRTGRDLRVLPKTVIYDPELTLTLPAAVTSTSGMNAMAHCVEALYAENWTPVVALMAEEGVRALRLGLPVAVAEPNDVAARSECLLGSHLAGAALGSSSMALHHRLCHVVGGMSRAGHGDLNAVVLPHIITFNASHAPDAMRRLCRALDVEDPGAGVFAFARQLAAPQSLAEIDVAEDILDEAARVIATNPGSNPRPYSAAEVRELLAAMFAGTHPQETART